MMTSSLGSHYRSPCPHSLAASHTLSKNFVLQSSSRVIRSISSVNSSVVSLSNHSRQGSSHFHDWSESCSRSVRCRRILTLPKLCCSDSRLNVSSVDVAEIKYVQPRGRSQGGEAVVRNGQASSHGQDDGIIRYKLAVFLSGAGSNFRALHTATHNNSIHGEVIVVVSDKPGCKGCEYAIENNVPILSYPRSKHAPDGLSSSDLVASLRKFGIDHVLLAGYLKLLPLELVQSYPRSILNIHPSLLPSFGGKGYYGMKVHEAVIKSGARFSGATVHFVDENFDSGPILAQRIVPVLSDDTPQDLAAKVLKVEHVLFSEAVAALCEDRIFWRADGVPLIRKSWNEAQYY